MGKLLIYSKENYEGSHNLLKAEKRLIIRAFLKSDREPKKMAELLEVSHTKLLYLIISHFAVLPEELFSKIV